MRVLKSKGGLLLALAMLCIFAAGMCFGLAIRKAPAPTVTPVTHCEPEEHTPTPTAKAIELEPQPTNLGEFKLTAYCACSKCCGQWADGITYTGTVATQGRTIAVDPDVIPLGSTVEIDGSEYIAEDIGGTIQQNRIDVFFSSHQEALEFGVQYADVLLKN